MERQIPIGLSFRNEIRREILPGIAWINPDTAGIGLCAEREQGRQTQND
jgi:hypothetical protein